MKAHTQETQAAITPDAAIDLLKEGKLKWVECGLDEWRKYVEKNFYDKKKL